MNKIILRIVQFLFLIKIIFITKYISGENYDSISVFGGSICVVILLLIQALYNERNDR